MRMLLERPWLHGGPQQQYTLDQSPSIADLAPRDDGASAAEQDGDDAGADGMRTLSIQLVRGRNLGMAGGRLLHVQVERDLDGTIGIGLDNDDRIVEVSNDKQLSLQRGDQVRAVDGVPLGDGNIVMAMRQVPREVAAFPVELVRWPRGASQPSCDVYAVLQTSARGGPGGERCLDRVETQLRDSLNAAFNASSIVTLRSAERHELRLQLFREGFWGWPLVGEARVDLTALGAARAPFTAWVPLLDGAEHVAGELLVRITRCDWATRIGTSPDTGHAEFAPRLELSALMRAPLHEPQPIARIADVPLEGGRAR